MSTTHTILNAEWTETERHERRLSNGQLRITIHVERPKARGVGTVRAWVTQDIGNETATMSHWSPRTFKIPAVSL